MADTQSPTFKLVLVGDGGTGKVSTENGPRRSARGLPRAGGSLHRGALLTGSVPVACIAASPLYLSWPDD